MSPAAIAALAVVLICGLFIAGVLLFGRLDDKPYVPRPGGDHQFAAWTPIRVPAEHSAGTPSDREPNR